MGEKLVCPGCGTDEALYSTENASIDYPVTVSREENGSVSLEYTGETYIVNDEGTVNGGFYFCRECIRTLEEHELVTRIEYKRLIDKAM